MLSSVVHQDHTLLSISPNEVNGEELGAKMDDIAAAEYPLYCAAYAVALAGCHLTSHAFLCPSNTSGGLSDGGRRRRRHIPMSTTKTHD